MKFSAVFRFSGSRFVDKMKIMTEDVKKFARQARTKRNLLEAVHQADQVLKEAESALVKHQNQVPKKEVGNCFYFPSPNYFCEKYFTELVFFTSLKLSICQFCSF